MNFESVNSDVTSWDTKGIPAALFPAATGVLSVTGSGRRFLHLSRNSLFLLAAFGMQYAKTRGAELLLNPTRSRILEVLDRGGPFCVIELERALQVARGTLQHHLHLLRRANAVTSHEAGRNHFYAPAGWTSDQVNRAIALRKLTESGVLQGLTFQPGMRQTELRGLIGCGKKAVTRLVRIGIAAGVLQCDSGRLRSLGGPRQ